MNAKRYENKDMCAPPEGAEGARSQDSLQGAGIAAPVPLPNGTAGAPQSDASVSPAHSSGCASIASQGEPVPGLPGRLRDPHTKVFLPVEPASALTEAERAAVDRQHAALIADLGPSPSATHVIIAGQVRDVLADLMLLRRDVEQHGAFARGGRRLRSAFAATAAAQDRLTGLLKLLTPARGSKPRADPAAALAAINARKR